MWGKQVPRDNAGSIEPARLGVWLFCSFFLPSIEQHVETETTMTGGLFKNIRVYCASCTQSDARALTMSSCSPRGIRVLCVCCATDLCCTCSRTATVGILLFGYDTGIAGGVVAQKAFKDEFLGPGATQKHADSVSQNVVSVLQAGAFFGALGSIPITSMYGRKRTLLGFSLLFSLGAVSAPFPFLLQGSRWTVPGDAAIVWPSCTRERAVDWARACVNRARCLRRRRPASPARLR